MKISKKVSIACKRLKTRQSKSRLLMPNRLVRQALNQKFDFNEQNGLCQEEVY